MNTKAALLEAKNKPLVTGVKHPPPAEQKHILGLLYVVRLRLVGRGTSEVINHRLLLIGCEEQDIERKLRWMFSVNEYSEFSLTKIERVHERMHVLETWITEKSTSPAAIIERAEGTQNVFQNTAARSAADGKEADDYRLFVVGVATKMPAKDELHALRKVGRALVAKGSPYHSDAGPSLSDESTVSVEAIAPSTKFAMPRDVSNFAGSARFVRG